ncbi:MAG: hypothetical protein WD844_13830 [Thermoleophilaceae bacterium]
MILGSLAAAAATAVTWALFAVTMLGPCGGDGGEPQADPDSSQGDVCRLLDPTWPERMLGGEPVTVRTWVILLLPGAIILVATLVGRLRGQARIGLGVGIALAFLALLVPVIAVAAIP